MNRNFRIGALAPVMLMLMAGASSAESVKTKFTAVNQSLEMLLDGGWTIVTGDLGGLILRNGGKWVSCRITIVRSGGGTPPVAISSCTALN
jgi:hypothetical protein